MAIGFERALGIHEQALLLRERRAEVLANNLANADTPGFKARDLDFRAVLAARSGDSGLAPVRTHARHLASGGDSLAEAALLYRVPEQPSIDGNTVDGHQEMARFSRNAVEFQASFHFLNSRITGLKNAIRGDS